MKKNILLALVSVLALSPAFASEPLRIAILGDSYSTFEAHMSPAINECWYFPENSPRRNKVNDVTTVEQTWWKLLIKDLGATLVQNNSYSGATIAFRGYVRQQENANDGHSLRPGHNADFSPRSFITRAVNLADSIGAADVILVFGGTNDSWADTPVGTYQWGKWSRADLFTFRPAMARLCHDLQELYPTSRVIFIINDGLRSEVVESIHTISAYYGMEHIDLQGIEKQSGHPSQKGMRAIADQVIAHLSQSAQ